jgi:hypothetical protein
MTTMSSRELHLDVEQVTKAVASGPVLVTVDEAEPSFVLLRFDEYKQELSVAAETQQEQLPVNAESKPFRSLLDSISMPEEFWGEETFELEFPRSRELPREIDLS